MLVDLPLTLAGLHYDSPGELTLRGDESLKLDAMDGVDAWIELADGHLAIDSLITNDPADDLQLDVAPTAVLDLLRSISPATMDMGKLGAGRLILRADNSGWTGAMNIHGGVVEVHQSTGLGQLVGDTTVHTGGTLTLPNAVQLDETIRLNGGSLEAGSSSTTTLGGILELAADSELAVTDPNGLVLLSGELQGSAQLLLTQGKFEFTGQDNHGGAVHVDGGELIVSSLLASPIKMLSGLAEIRAAGVNSGNLTLAGGKVTMLQPAADTFGGEILLLAGELHAAAPGNTRIGRLTLAADTQGVVSVAPSRNLTVTGGIIGPGNLVMVNRGNVSITQAPVEHLGDWTLIGQGSTTVAQPINAGGKVHLKEGTLKVNSAGTSPIIQSADTDLIFDNLTKGYQGAVDVIGPASISTQAGGRLDGAVSIESGTVRLHSLSNTLTVAGPITGSGSLEIRTSASDSIADVLAPIDVAGDLTLTTGTSGNAILLDRVNVGGHLQIAGATTIFRDTLMAFGGMDVESNATTTLAGKDNVVTGQLNSLSELVIDGRTTVVSLSLVGLPSRPMRLSGMGDVYVGNTVDIQKAVVDFSTGSIVGAPTVIKTSHEQAELRNIGKKFTGRVQVQEGMLSVTRGMALGGGEVSLEGEDALIELAADTPILGTLYLNNWNGRDQSGAVYTGVNTGQQAFIGDVYLGDVGASLLGSRSLLTLRGDIHGGDLILRSTQSSTPTLDLTTDQHTYQGSTHVDGGGRLRLSEAASLHSTQEITIGTTSELEIHNDAQIGISADRLGDHIPMTLAGGQLALSNSIAVNETLGPITLQPGANELRIDAPGSELTLASLQTTPLAALLVDANLGSTKPQAARLAIQDATAADFLGGAIRVRDDEGIHFARYDTNEGLLPLLSDGYAPASPASWTAGSHALVTDSQQLNRDTDALSITLRDTGQGTPQLDLNGFALNSHSGGLIMGASPSSIVGGRLTAGGSSPAAEFHMIAPYDAEITSDIVDNPGADGQYDVQSAGPLDADNGIVHLVKSGDGMLRLGGTNTYRGDTHVYQGTLKVTQSSAIPSTTHLTIDGGRLELDENVIASPASLTVRHGHVVDFGGAIRTPQVILEMGSTVVPLLGGGEIIKTTVGEFHLGSIPNYEGDVQVEQGILRAEHLGHGLTTVHPGAVLTGTRLQGNIELRGGEVRSPYGTSLFMLGVNDDHDATVATVADSVLDATEGSIHIRSHLHVGAGTTLTKLGARDFGANKITLGDNSRLFVEDGLTDLGSRVNTVGSRLYVGENATIEARSGETRVSGILTATHADSRLSLVGDASYALNFDIDLGDGHNLSLLHNDVAIPITFRDEPFLRGHGTLNNSVALTNHGVVRPGVAVGQLTINGQLSVEPESVFKFQMYDASGQAGSRTGWDHLQVTQSIDFQSSARDAYHLEVTTVDDEGLAAPVLNFDPRFNQQWSLISAASLGGLDADSFSLDAIAFQSEHTLPRGADFHLSATDTELLLNYDVVLGDFDLNRTLDARDIDQLSAQIRTGNADLTMDLNLDGELNLLDHTFWVKDVRQVWYGDANLDGAFNSADILLALSAGQYEDEITNNSGWASGDWNADGEFTSSDMVVALSDGGYELAAPSTPVSVPEPAAVVLFAAAMVAILHRKRQ